MWRKLVITAGRRGLAWAGPAAARAMPPGAVYPVAVRASGWAAQALEACGVRHLWGLPLRERLLAETLSALSRGGARFPLRARIEREKELRALYEREGRLLGVSAHVSLNRLLHRRLREWGLPVRALVRRWDGPAWGLGEEVDLLWRSPHVLMEAREALRRGAVVLITLDETRARHPDGGYTAELNAAALCFAHRTRTPVIAYRSRLDDDGWGRVRWQEGGDVHAPYAEFERDCRRAFEQIYSEPSDPRFIWLSTAKTLSRAA